MAATKSLSKKTPVAPGETKAVKEKKSTQIKYFDKSAGQPELTPIFEEIKTKMQRYAKGSIVEKIGKVGMYNLISKKSVEINGKKRPEIYFAGLMVQKGYVGFYFMPAYEEEGFKSNLKPELLKFLKGKSCFHIKKNDAVIMEQIEAALEVGHKIYENNGWVD